MSEMENKDGFHLTCVVCQLSDLGAGYLSPRTSVARYKAEDNYTAFTGCLSVVMIPHAGQGFAIG